MIKLLVEHARGSETGSLVREETAQERITRRAAGEASRIRAGAAWVAYHRGLCGSDW